MTLNAVEAMIEIWPGGTVDGVKSPRVCLNYSDDCSIMYSGRDGEGQRKGKVLLNGSL